jgi:uncharacterized protein (TIGR00725 family)
MPRRPQIAVVGAAAASPAELAAAEQVGAAIARLGGRLICGGRGGVMAAAARGVQGTGAKDRVVGVLPGTDASDANEWVDVVVPTGIGLARNAIVVTAADAVVAVGGGSGTLSELALAWQLGKPIVAVDTGSGWASELAGRQVDGKRGDSILRAADAAEAEALLAGLLEGRR